MSEKQQGEPGMNRLFRGLITGAAVVALGVTGYHAAGAAPGKGEPSRGAPVANAEILVALQRDLGLSSAQANTVRAEQEKAAGIDIALQVRLGTTFGGSWFDAAAGKLVVGVTDAKQVAEVTKAGALARVVKHSKAELDGIKAELDTIAGKTDREHAAKGVPAAVAGLAGWHVDPVSNSVVVTAVKGTARAAALNTVARHGDAVRVEQTATMPKQTADFIDGGDEINFGGCSAGFNLRNPSTGQGYLLTAGHCVSAGGSTYGQGSNFFGTVLESFFPTFDDAIIRADNPGYWIQGPWVDTNPSNGGYINVSGYSDSAVGTLMCKSGITTKWTCGYIRVKDETVVYSAGAVYGMTRHSACVEPGDSGGANVAALNVWSPEGVTSGAQLYWDGSRYRCAAAVGAGESVSWYFPIADSLAWYGPRYGVSTW
jgi:streptogrisin C